MDEIKNIDRKATLWIIRLQNKLSYIFHSRILSSLMIFYVPLMISGFLLGKILKYSIFTRGVLISLLWIGIAPYLIQSAFKLVVKFFYDYKDVFKSKDEWNNHFNFEVERLQSSKYLIFGIPWSIITSTIVLLTNYMNAPFLIKVWVFISFFMLFFLSAIGFYGVYIIITLIKNICRLNIIFNPFHPDKFGGFANVGRFSVKGSLYFSSGALVFPLVIETMSKYSNGSSILNIAIYILSAIFIVTMMSSFILPILEIKKFVDTKKEITILKSWSKMEGLIKEFDEKSEFNIKDASNILLHYYFHHSKLLQVKDYPYDFKVLVEFGFSFIIPIGIAIFELCLK